MNISASVSLTAGTIFLTATAAFAVDWPQYRGPNLDSTTSEKISSHWSAAGPKQLWKVPTTDGFSSFVVSGGKVFTVVRRTVETVPWEVCVALDANTGNGLWATPVGLSKYDTEEGNSGAPDNKGGDGPRTTPSVDGNHVYVMSGHLALHCLDAATGKEVWKHDLKEEFAGREVRWQNAAAPLIEGGLVLVTDEGLHRDDARRERRHCFLLRRLRRGFRRGEDQQERRRVECGGTLAPARERPQQPLEHARAQGRPSLWPVRLQGIRQVPAQVRRDRHRQGRLVAGRLRPRRMRPRRRTTRGARRFGPGRHRGPEPQGLRRAGPRERHHRQMLVHARRRQRPHLRAQHQGRRLPRCEHQERGKKLTEAANSIRNSREPCENT
ncbi:MAG: PQQ-binding-like beta-propeller repeat protein [Verrucomicrobia bacterium]|nr:PQQ-binding-like beta-propeller repeat protein [Verrucomicrobiota bacterium]